MADLYRQLYQLEGRRNDKKEFESHRAEARGCLEQLNRLHPEAKDPFGIPMVDELEGLLP